MRRYVAALGMAALVGVGATSAWAAMPPSNAQYAGGGNNYWNENGHWVRHGSGTFGFKTSSPGQFQYVDNFHGTYTVRCKGGTLHVSANNMLIHSNGTFSHSFVSSGAHVRIWGVFTGSGSTANVNYLVNFSGPNTNPKGLRSSCATWVHGIAHTPVVRH